MFKSPISASNKEKIPAFLFFFFFFGNYDYEGDKITPHSLQEEIYMAEFTLSIHKPNMQLAFTYRSLQDFSLGFPRMSKFTRNVQRTRERFTRSNLWLLNQPLKESEYLNLKLLAKKFLTLQVKSVAEMNPLLCTWPDICQTR